MFHRLTVCIGLLFATAAYSAEPDTSVVTVEARPGVMRCLRHSAGSGSAG